MATSGDEQHGGLDGTGDLPRPPATSHCPSRETPARRAVGLVPPLRERGRPPSTKATKAVLGHGTPDRSPGPAPDRPPTTVGNGIPEQMP